MAAVEGKKKVKKVEKVQEQAVRPAVQEGARTPDFGADPANYVNRELSWLEFNYRVLSEASDKTIPLCERMKF